MTTTVIEYEVGQEEQAHVVQFEGSMGALAMTEEERETWDWWEREARWDRLVQEERER
jgi:hypothetical protein